MSEPEIIRLRKKISSLTELNTQLNEQIQELSIQLGEYQARNLEFKNNNLLLRVQKEKATNEEALRIQLDQAISEEKSKSNEIKKENEKLKEKITYLENLVKDNEIYIQKLQISKFDEQREKQTREFNELCDNMEKVISENRLLRQIADVPENYGLDISKIRIGDRIKIEDYKAKIRILQHDIDDLESERAQLKHRIQFLANSLNVSEPPFHLLTPEQKVEVARYAQNLHEGKENTQPEKYDLVARLREKDNQIRVLDEELNRLRAEGRGQGSNTGLLRVPNPNTNNQLET